MKKVFKWLVVSSADPKKVSLTVKAVLTGLIPLAIAVSGVTEIPLDQNSMQAVASTVAQFVETALTLVSITLTAAGLLRKIYLSVIGENAVLQ